jgi:hypothetical protein
MIDFPSSPTVGQTYVFGARTWQWNGSGWARLVNAGQIVSVFVLLSPINLDSAIALPIPITTTWTQLNYV